MSDIRPTPHRWWTPLRIALIYALAAGGWIGGSTFVLHLWHSDEDIWIPEFLKGMAFVGVSATLLWGMCWRMSVEREGQARKIEKARARYEAMFEHLPMPTFVYDPDSLKVLAVNATAVERWGWTRDELKSMTIGDLCGVPAHQRDANATREVVDTLAGREGDVCVYAMRGKDGRVYPAQISSIPIEFDGRPARQVVALDVSDVVEARDELRKANATLESRVAERTEKLQRTLTELEWFSETVSQDLRGPLMHLREMATALVQHAPDQMSTEDLERAHRMVGSAARLCNLVEELLDYARLEGADSAGLTDHSQSAPEIVSLVLLVSELAGQLARERTVGTETHSHPPHPVAVRIIEPLYWTKARRPMLARVVKAMLRLAVHGEEGADESHAAHGSADVVVRADHNQDSLRLEVLFHRHRLSTVTRSALLKREVEAQSSLARGTSMALLLRTAHRLGGNLWYEDAAKENEGKLVLKLPYAEPG